MPCLVTYFVLHLHYISSECPLQFSFQHMLVGFFSICCNQNAVVFCSSDGSIGPGRISSMSVEDDGSSFILSQSFGGSTVTELSSVFSMSEDASISHLLKPILKFAMEMSKILITSSVTSVIINIITDIIPIVLIIIIIIIKHLSYM